MCKYAELTVLVPVSQYVKVEAAAAEGKRSLESTASFLLSEWVLATHSKQHGGDNRAMDGKCAGEAKARREAASEAPEGPARGRAQSNGTKKGMVRT